jgi:hypothetical protein
MKYSHRILLLLALTLFALLGNGDCLNAKEIETFRIRVGTLEPVEEPEKRGYLFRCPDGDELFVVARDQHLSSKKVEMAFPYPAGLQPIGFKLDNGLEYLYKTPAGVRSELATAQAAAAENPGSKAVAIIFAGQAKSRLEIMLSGKTPVIRVDIEIDGKTVTLWSARKLDEPAK